MNQDTSRIRVLASLPSGTQLETVAVGTNGDIYVSSYSERRVLTYAPGQAAPAFRELAVLDCHPIGLCWGRDDSLWVTAHAKAVATVAEPHADNNLLLQISSDGRVVSTTPIKDALFLNDMTELPDGRLVAVDSVIGAVLELRAATPGIVLSRAEMLAPPARPARLPAANGLATFAGRLFVSNPARNCIISAPIEDLSHWRTDFPETSIDNFAIGRSGAIYAATHRNDVLRLLRDSRDVIATPEDGVAGNTAVAFGRRADDRTSIYVIATGVGAPQSPPGKANLVQIHVDDVSA